MLSRPQFWSGVAVAVVLVCPRHAFAQTHHHATSPPDSTRAGVKAKAAPKHPAPRKREAPTMGSMPGMDMSGMHMPGMDHEHMGHTMDHGGHMAMSAMYGPYPMTREASGTSWQPDLAMHHGIHEMKGAWTLMLHGQADLVLDGQGGGRGDDKIFSSNMLMGMAQRRVGPGRLGFRSMV